MKALDSFQSPSRKWQHTDTLWMLGLYGTAIGAGVLFLPINAGIGGLWPLFIMAAMAFPMTYFSHLGLTRFVLSSAKKNADITEVVEEYFGLTAGKCITFLYFFAIYPILLVYSVAITNTVQNFLLNQLHITPPPRLVLSFILLCALMGIAHFGADTIVKTMSILVFPFILVLILLSLYLIPHWSLTAFTTAQNLNRKHNLFMTLWLALPVMVFSFNFSPIISSFSVAKQAEYGNMAYEKTSKILKCATAMMVITVMLFVFSCVLSLSPADLMEAKQQNISILSYLANHFHNPLIAYAAPLVAMVAISKSFLGHYLGAKEGLQGIILKHIRTKKEDINTKAIDRITVLLMLITSWIVAASNPSILGLIETLGGPIIAIILFLMPMYATYKVPAMHRYRHQVSNIFIILIGSISVSAILYTLFF